MRRKLRDFDEIGTVSGVSGKAAEAYRTYASLWLDHNKDDLTRFIDSGIFVEPLTRIQGERTEDKCYDAYLDAATEVVTDYYYNGGRGLKLGYWFKEYPLLKDREEAITNVYNSCKGIFDAKSKIPSMIETEAPVANDDEIEFEK